MRHVIAAISLVLVLTADAAAAAKKKSASTLAPAPARADTVAKAVVSPGPVSRTPGPLITPGSPIEDRTTIVPFPAPGDTSRGASERAKLLNVPREGVTTFELLPRGVGAWPERVGVSQYSMSLQAPVQLTEPVPEYPKAARDAGIQGTVMVMACVGTDGTVGGTGVVKSIPALDDAAVRAVKRLRFKPASYLGRPVVAWAGVPVKFTLH